MYVVLILYGFLRCAAGQQPNPPVWPSSVQVFGPEDNDATIAKAVEAAYDSNGGHRPSNHGEFSQERFAFLFKPGEYHIDVPVGYYTQIAGLGQQPSDVVFDGSKGVHCEEGDQSDRGGALSTFWRIAENFHRKGNMLWAASQASPVRRAQIDGVLNLAQSVPRIGMGYSSGGFLGNVKVNGKVFSGSQQQFCSRNVDVEGWPQGNWNMAFIGVQGGPATHCSHNGGIPATSVPVTPLVAEKPFISFNPDTQRYYLNVPPVQHGRVGTDFSNGEVIDFESVFVARASDSAARINSFLTQGFHVVLSPGIYHIDETLELQHDGQVLLGLGLATLVSANGVICVRVKSQVLGARVAGILLQAGPQMSGALLVWGDGKAGEGGSADKPGFLHDVFARVGGANNPNQEQMRCEVMVHIASNHVVGDNLWLWRADHGVSGITKQEMNPVRHGLVVTGNYVTMYGLAVEHTLEDQVQWYGEHGHTFFFQSELPYDVTPAYGTAGFVGYRVVDGVNAHAAHAVGVYHFFRDYPVIVKRAIAVPSWLENSIENPLSVYLTGLGQVQHVLNKFGKKTGKGLSQVQYVCEQRPFASPNPSPMHVPLTPGTPGWQPEPEPTPDTWAPEPETQPQAPWYPWQQSPSQPTNAQSGQGSSALPWWVVLLLLQAGLIISLVTYATRLRWRMARTNAERDSLGFIGAADSSPIRTTKQRRSRPGSAPLVESAHSSSSVFSPFRRWMSGSMAGSPTQSIRGMFGGQSPPPNRDIARTISRNSMSPFGERSPVWRADDTQMC